MIRSISESPLYPIVNPKSIAFFGASNTFMRMGSIMLSSMQALGYEGKIFPIHPKEKVVRGLEAYTSILDVPEIPDLAIIVLPTEIVCQTLDDCGKKGIRHAIVVSGGFREAGPEGAVLQKELEAIARRHGIRFWAPTVWASPIFTSSSIPRPSRRIARRALSAWRPKAEASSRRCSITSTATAWGSARL
jgi:predicted CoA-binding protein